MLAVNDLPLHIAAVQGTAPQVIALGFDVLAGTGTGDTCYRRGVVSRGPVTIDSVTPVVAAVREPASIVPVAVGVLTAAGSRRRRSAA